MFDTLQFLCAGITITLEHIRTRDCILIMTVSAITRFILNIRSIIVVLYSLSIMARY